MNDEFKAAQVPFFIYSIICSPEKEKYAISKSKSQSMVRK
jgi:hypothetical protein